MSIEKHGWKLILVDAEEKRNLRYPANFLGHKGMVCCAAVKLNENSRTETQKLLNESNSLKIEKYGFEYHLKRIDHERNLIYPAKAFGYFGMVICAVVKKKNKRKA